MILELTHGGLITLGDRVELGAGAVLSSHGGRIDIENDVYIGPYCVLYGHGGLRVGRDTMIAAHGVIIPANHGFDALDIPIRLQPLTHKGIEIGPDCWIGSGVRVLDGVRIAGGCVVGAGAVVTRSIPDRSIALGVPARVAGTRPNQS